MFETIVYMIGLDFAVIKNFYACLKTSGSMAQYVLGLSLGPNSVVSSQQAYLTGQEGD